MDQFTIEVCNAPNAASHNRSAFSSIASNTGLRSPGEELMTCNTSAVAVSLFQRLVALGNYLCEPHLEFRDDLLRIGECAVGHRAPLRTSLGPTCRVDHTVIGTGHHRLSIGRVS